MSGWQWLNDLMNWLSRWVPRIVLIRAMHRGVLFGPRGSVTEKQPGLHIFWPIAQELEIVSLRNRTTECAAQVVGAEVISLTVEFKIVDPVQMFLGLHDVVSYVDDSTQRLLIVHRTHGIESGVLAAKVHVDLSDALAVHGVGIVGVGVLQRGPAIPIKLLNDWANHCPK